MNLKTKTVKTRKIITFLEQERTRRHLSLDAWADEMGVNLSTYTKWLYGQNAPMAETLLEALEKAGFKVLLKRKEGKADV